jgi:hypothetical protein
MLPFWQNEPSFVLAIQWDGFQPLGLAGWIKSGSAVAGGAAAALCPARGSDPPTMADGADANAGFRFGGRAPDRIRGHDETEGARTVTHDMPLARPWRMGQNRTAHGRA